MSKRSENEALTPAFRYNEVLLYQGMKLFLLFFLFLVV